MPECSLYSIADVNRAVAAAQGGPYLHFRERKEEVIEVKRLVLIVGLVAVVMLGSLAAIPAKSTDTSAGYVGGSDSQVAPARSADLRLMFINQALYPDDAVVDDWLCDGMAPCIELSPR